jgi:hypothetical protein
MTTRAPFLTTPYGGYLHNEVPKEDEELTHVGPGTPGGEYLRRFWHPVVRSDALQDLPVRVRILGEDLVVFRAGLDGQPIGDDMYRHSEGGGQDMAAY